MNTLPNLVKSGLAILFVGINPGLRSAEIGHHFGGRSNRFWRFLNDSGLTPFRLDATRDYQLLDFGYGITNIIHRPTSSASELCPGEFETGAQILISLLKEYQPRIAAYLGKDIYYYLCKHKNLKWGIQDHQVAPPVIDFLLPNPSGLNRIPLAEQLKYYQQLRKIVQENSSAF